MDDLTITRLCAEAMGFRTQIAVDMQTSKGDEYLLVWSDNSVYHNWNPLHDDAQCMALVKKFGLWIDALGSGIWNVCPSSTKHDHPHAMAPDLNRAICECVAKLQSSKGKR